MQEEIYVYHACLSNGMHIYNDAKAFSASRTPPTRNRVIVAWQVQLIEYFTLTLVITERWRWGLGAVKAIKVLAACNWI